MTADDYEEVPRFYRDVLGMPKRDAIAGPAGRATILEAGHIRVARELDDAERATARLAEASAEVIAEPRRGPFNTVSSRPTAPAGLQLTLWSTTEERSDTARPSHRPLPLAMRVVVIFRPPGGDGRRVVPGRDPCAQRRTGRVGRVGGSSGRTCGRKYRMRRRSSSIRLPVPREGKSQATDAVCRTTSMRVDGGRRPFLTSGKGPGGFVGGYR